MSPPPSSLPEETHCRPKSSVMLARVAGSLYWMSRYLERAENQARLIDVNLNLLLDFGHLSSSQLKDHWLPIVRSSGDEELFARLYQNADNRSVTEFMSLCRDNPNSLISCISAARENARQVRDQISSEMWEVLNEAHHFIQRSRPQDLWHQGASAFYERIKRYSHLFQGITVSTFSRNEGFEFIQFGKYLERADQITRLLDMKYHILLPTAAEVGGALDSAQWHAILRSASALEAYRRAYVSEVHYLKVIEFLLFDPHFPRGLRFCCQEMAHFIGLIEQHHCPPEGHSASRRFAGFCARLEREHVRAVVQRGLHEYLDEAQLEIAEAGNLLYQNYMYHPAVDLNAEIRFHQQQEQQQQEQQQQSEPLQRQTADSTVTEATSKALDPDRNPR